MEGKGPDQDLVSVSLSTSYWYLDLITDPNPSSLSLGGAGTHQTLIGYYIGNLYVAAVFQITMLTATEHINNLQYGREHIRPVRAMKTCGGLRPAVVLPR